MNAVMPLNQTFHTQILENLSTSVLMTNTDFVPIFINPAAEELFGISMRMVGQFNLADVMVDDGPKTLLDCLKVAEGGRQSCTYHEITIKSPNSAEQAVNCTVVPLYEASTDCGFLIEINRVDRILKIAHDEQQIAQHMTARAIARGLAHEVNNPLGGLRGAAQLLERELPEEAREYTRIIISEADRLRALVKNMLGPRSLPQKSELSIHEILNHVIKLILAEANGNLKIQLDYDPSIPSIPIDRDQLIQAILNIVRNAWQAVRDNESGQITLRTRVLRYCHIGHTLHKLVLQLQVIDNGPGIPEDKLEYIFFPMVTGRSEGTGLGLTIAQSLVSMHGGLIECESDAGNTTFSILLPFNHSSESKDGQTG